MPLHDCLVIYALSFPEGNVMIGSLPGGIFGKVQGEIDCRVARNQLGIEPNAVHTQPLWY